MDALSQTHQTLLRQDLLLRGSSRNPQEASALIKGSFHLASPTWAQEKKGILTPLLALEAFTGQRAQVTTSQQMVPSLKIRRGMVLGAKVTLRGSSLSAFLLRLAFLALPALPQWKGIPLPEGNSLSFRMGRGVAFREWERHHDLFQELPPLDLTFQASGKEGEAFLRSLPLAFTSSTSTPSSLG